ncbi:hypothetical protein EXU57_24405 [Segetibacter sp. 3557_3]|uniref:hypothetical protein n=1 Tax=Segetibacter sp. 3557_3 TaxID=2547429 RepID=UPI0010583B8C|nr:hypothetical protein [Segetibacter sp. 3557_3]TDH18066.1 hypothetical protein EXU57_24405 [Segetibacter sp. 3557_3]
MKFFFIATLSILLSVKNTCSQVNKEFIFNSIYDLKDAYISRIDTLVYTITNIQNPKIEFYPPLRGSITLSNKVIKYVPHETDAPIINVRVSQDGGDTANYSIVRNKYEMDYQTFLKRPASDAISRKSFYDIVIDSVSKEDQELIIKGIDIDFTKGSVFTTYTYQEGDVFFNYKRVKIYAKNLTLGTVVKFPGAKVVVYADSLILANKDNPVGIDIQPLTRNRLVRASVSEKAEGDKGDTADTLFLFVNKVKIENDLRHSGSMAHLNYYFSARGGSGEAAPTGNHGQDFDRLQPFSVSNSLGATAADGTCRYFPNLIENPTLPVRDNFIYLNYLKKVSTTETRSRGVRGEDYTVACDYWMQSVIDNWGRVFTPARLEAAKPRQGGRPGAGGDGGVIVTNSQLVKDRSTTPAGYPGESDVIRKGGKVPAPTGPLYSYTFSEKNGVVLRSDFHEISIPREISLSPLAVNPLIVSHNGSINLENVSNGNNISYITYVIDHADLLYKFGNLKEANDVYDYCVNHYFSDQSLALDAKSLQYKNLAILNKEKIKSSLDYYGNPYSWVPQLNFVTNFDLYQKNIENSFEAIASSMYILKMHKGHNAKIEDLEQQLSLLRRNNEFYQEKIATIQSEMPLIEAQLQLLKIKIDDADAELRRLENEISAMAEGSVREKEKKHRQKSLLKAVTTVAKVIPVYQPALGMVATGVDAIALREDNTSFIDVVGSAVSDYQDMKSIREGLSNNLRNAYSLSVNSTGNVNLQTLYQNKQQLVSELKPVYEKVTEIYERIKPSKLPANLYEEELARIKNEHPEYKNMIDSIAALGKMNNEVSQQLIKLASAITEASNSIYNNVDAIYGIKNDLEINKRISPETIDYLTAIKKDAIERLLYYQYLFGKAYEYFSLKQYDGYKNTIKLLHNGKEFESYADPSTILSAIKNLFNNELNASVSGILAKLNTDYGANVQQKVRIRIIGSDLEKINRGDTVSVNFFRNPIYNVFENQKYDYADILIKDVTVEPEYKATNIE